MRSERPGGARRRWRGAAWLASLVLWWAPSALGAQAIQAVALRISPRVGDTLVTRFEQRIEMQGNAAARRGAAPVSVTGTLRLLSRVFVQARDEDGTTVTTLIDSVSLEGIGVGTSEAGLRRAIEGKRIRLLIAPNGSASVLQAPADFGADLQSVVSGMPSTLPDRPVRPGATWTTTMSIPVSGATGPAPSALLRATYRLDSLSAGGDYAWISMRGTLSRPMVAARQPPGGRITSSGTVTGGMQVDRRRGWWVESHASIALSSRVTSADGDSARAMTVETRITEQMRAGPAR